MVLIFKNWIIIIKERYYYKNFAWEKAQNKLQKYFELSIEKKKIEYNSPKKKKRKLKKLKEKRTKKVKLNKTKKCKIVRKFKTIRNILRIMLVHLF